jgi:hypothetical protein
LLVLQVINAAAGSTEAKLAMLPDSQVTCNYVAFLTGVIAAAQHQFRYAISNISLTNTPARNGQSGVCIAAAAPTTEKGRFGNVDVGGQREWCVHVYVVVDDFSGWYRV